MSVPLRTTVAVQRRAAGGGGHRVAATVVATRLLVASEAEPTDEQTTEAASEAAASAGGDSSSTPPSSSPRSVYPSLCLFRTHVWVGVCVSLSLLLYLNALHGAFVFDDHFALVDNADTQTNAPPIHTAFHDFWGAPLSSPSSHKSYRPATIWSWRLQRTLVQLIMGAEALYVDGDPAAASVPEPPLGFLRQFFLSVATPPPQTPASRAHSFGSHADGGSDDPGGASGSGDMGASPERSPTASVLLKRNWWPFVFHASNTFLHMVNTSLVYWLAFAIFGMRVSRHEPESEPEAGASCGESCTGEGCTGGSDGNSSSSSSAAASNRNPDDLFRRRAILLASLTAFFFAVHPVHTEAVSGIVGHADLLCCAFFLCALLLWWGGNLCAGVSSSSADPADPSMLQPFRAALTNAALVCFLASTFSKEVGFTIVAVFVVVDSVHAAIILCVGGVPFPPLSSAPAATATAANTNANERGQQQHHPSKRGGGGGGNGNSGSGSASSSSIGGTSIPSSTPPTIPLRSWCLHFASLVWPRFLLLLLLSTFYLLLRRMLCGSALGVGEAVFRPVENPLAFEARFLPRVATRAAVHAKYAQLLFMPWNLCCDYSLACIPVVERIDDLRWLPGLALWGAVLAAVGWAVIQLVRLLDARRRETMKIVWAMHVGLPAPLPSFSSGASATAAATTTATVNVAPSSSSSSSSGAKSKWRALSLFRGFFSLSGPCHSAFGPANPALNLSFLVSLVLSLTLMLAPLVPALHLFAYPGTLVAERLLYVPSVGACMLMALGVERACFAGVEWRELDEVTPQNRQTKATGPASATSSSAPAPSPRPLRAPHRRRLLLLTLLSLATLATWCGLTLRRNADWSSERSLFTSAYSVCPRSIKVLQNLAVLHRREGDYPRALSLLHRIPGLDPGGTYCEHHYWIGLSKVNMGSVEPGVAALKRALACPYTRNQALAALHKLFEQMLKSGAEGAAVEGQKKAGGNAAPSSAPSPAQLKQELHVLREWASIMAEVGQDESASKYFLHAGGLAYTAGEVLAARKDFERAWLASRRLVYDWKGRLINDPNVPPHGWDATGDGEGEGENDLAAWEDAAGGAGASGPESTDPPADSSPESNIYSSRNMRCASDYWLGRTQLQLGQVSSGVALLRQVVLASSATARVNNCREFKMHALDHLAEQAQRELHAVAEEAKGAPAASASASSSKAKSKKRDRADKRAAAGSDASSGAATSGNDSSVSRQAEAHALLAFVLSHLGKNVTAAQHFHASAHLLEGKIEGAAGAKAGDATANAATNAPPSATPLPAPSAASRSRAVELYRLAIAHDPQLERARYALAIALIETNRGVEEGVLLLRTTVKSADPQVRSSSLAALHTLEMVYGIVNHPQ